VASSTPGALNNSLFDVQLIKTDYEIQTIAQECAVKHKGHRLFSSSLDKQGSLLAQKAAAAYYSLIFPSAVGMVRCLHADTFKVSNTSIFPFQTKECLQFQLVIMYRLQ